jgi:hypothetical protein
MHCGGAAMVTIVNDELLIVRLSGVFDSAALLALAHEMNDIEAAGEHLKRLVYVDDSVSAAVTSDDVMFYKSYRQKPLEIVESAFCAFNEFQYGMARMFQSLLESEQHKIEIFRDIESAAQWLNIDSAFLEKNSLGFQQTPIRERSRSCWPRQSVVEPGNGSFVSFFKHFPVGIAPRVGL